MINRDIFLFIQRKKLRLQSKISLIYCLTRGWPALRAGEFTKKMFYVKIYFYFIEDLIKIFYRTFENIVLN